MIDLESPRVHGGTTPAELRARGLDPARVLDFSVSTNPYGPSAAVLAAVRHASIDRYPDPTAFEVREAIAAREGVRPDEVVFGNGACDLVWTLARVLARPGAPALVVEPTFSEFAAGWRAAGGRVYEWRAQPESSFAVDLDGIAAELRRSGARVLYLATPNSPTGRHVPIAELIAFAAGFPEVLVLADQSFLSLSQAHAEVSVRPPASTVRIRSFTKEHAIPGVRAGYVLADADLCRRVEEGRPAWSTSSIAQAAALAACREDAFVTASREKMLADRDRIVVGLTCLGLAPSPSVAAFVLVRVPVAERVAEALLERGIVVRSGVSFGLPDHIRVSARPEAEARRLLEALAEILA